MLGFSLLKNNFLFVDIQYQDGKPVVNQFAKRATPVPFTPESVMDEISKSEFRTLIEEAINFYKLSGPVAVSLDSQFAMVRKIMVDLTFSEAETEEQIVWEMRQIIPEESLSNYQFIYEELPGGYYQDQKALLFVLFRKDLLATVKELFLDSPLTVQFVEPDLFSAMYGTNRLFGTREYDLCFLADLKQNALKAVAVRKGEFFEQDQILFNQDDEEQEAMTYDSDESLANLINKEIRRKLLDYGLEEGKQIDLLFLYGERANSNLVDIVQENSPAKEVVLIEPFKKLAVNPEIASQVEDLTASGEYLVCVGSALRSIL